MTDLVAEPVKEYPQFEAALCLLPVLPPDEAVALLRQRLTRLEEKVADIEAHYRSPELKNLPPLFLIETEYRLALLKAEQHFVADLIKRIENGWGPLDLWRALHADHEGTLASLYKQFGGEPMT
jgi:hypothetical protein